MDNAIISRVSDDLYERTIQLMQEVNAMDEEERAKNWDAIQLRIETLKAELQGLRELMNQGAKAP